MEKEMLPEKVEEELKEAIEAFEIDPPDNDFQTGFMQGLLYVYREILCLQINNPKRTLN